MKRPNRLGITAVIMASALLLSITLVSPVFAARGDKAASEEFFQDAKKYLKNGDANAAVIQLKNALQKDRNHIGARKLLGEIYLRVGNGPAAEKELKAALRQGGDDVRLQIQIARAYVLQGKYKEILKELKDEVADNTVRGAILNLRGHAYFGLNMRDDAKASFEEAARLQPDDAKPKIGLAKIFISTGRLKEGEEQLQAALKNNAKSVEALVLKGELKRLKNDAEGALAAFESAVEINNMNIPARLGRAATLIDLGKDEQAQPDIDAVFSRVPKQPLASFLSALILTKKKDFGGALEMLHQGTPALDDYMPYVFLSGAVNYALDNFEQAAEHLRRYVAAVPDNIRARKLLGATYVRNNNPVGAIDILKPIVETNKADAQVLALLGSAYMRTGKFAEGSELFERAVKAAPDVSAIRTQLALSRLAQGSSDKAVGELEAAVDLDPEAQQASILLTLVHLRKSQYDKALESAERLHKRMPDNPMAQNLMGAAYLGKEDLVKARETFEAALKIKSDFHPARMNLAQLDIREGNLDRAVKNYRLILQDDPKHLGALLAMADAAQQQKNWDMVVEWLRKAGDANPKAIVPKQRLIQHYLQQRDMPRALSVAHGLDRSIPNNPQVLEIVGRTEIAAGQLENAVSTFRRLASVAENSPRAYQLLGGAMVAANDRQGAKKSFRKAIDLDEKFIPAIIGLAELEAQDGNLDAALKLAAEIGEKQPQSAVGATLAGDVYMRSGQYGKALASYEEAVGKEDTGSLALRIFNARNSLGQKEEGLRKLQQWVDRKNDAAARQALAGAYIANERYEAAIRESEKLLKDTPDNPVVLNNLAWLYDQKDDPRAIGTAEKALKQAPGSPEIMDTLGWILTRRGDLGRGVEMLENAHRAAPKQGDIGYHLAVALKKSGKAKEAKRVLESVFNAGGQFSESANAQKLLKELGG